MLSSKSIFPQIIKCTRVTFHTEAFPLITSSINLVLLLSTDRLHAGGKLHAQPQLRPCCDRWAHKVAAEPHTWCPPPGQHHCHGPQGIYGKRLQVKVITDPTALTILNDIYTNANYKPTIYTNTITIRLPIILNNWHPQDLQPLINTVQRMGLMGSTWRV